MRFFHCNFASISLRDGTHLLKGQDIVLTPGQPEHAGLLLPTGSAKNSFALKTTGESQWVAFCQLCRFPIVWLDLTVAFL